MTLSFKILGTMSALILCSACSPSNTTMIDGFVGTEGGGFARQQIYAFTEDQVKQTIASVEQKTHQAALADEVFAALPLDKCVAETKSGEYSGAFRLAIPNHGNFVLAADGHGYGARTERNGRWFAEEGKLTYWLYRVQTNGEPSMKIKLSEKNTLAANAPGQISVAVPDSYAVTPEDMPFKH